MITNFINIGLISIYKAKNLFKSTNKKYINDVIETLKIILNKNLPKSTKINNNTILPFGNHKLILGYLNAYFNQCPIKLNPNIIWQLVLNNSSGYVRDHSDMQK